MTSGGEYDTGADCSPDQIAETVAAARAALKLAESVIEQSLEAYRAVIIDHNLDPDHFINPEFEAEEVNPLVDMIGQVAFQKFAVDQATENMPPLLPVENEAADGSFFTIQA
jgi:hypothetical protein